MANTSHPPLIAGLLMPTAYPHSVRDVVLRETHISWVLLTGEYAYKIKKPVDLGFVDFTSLDKRLHCCQEEIRLNRRYADDLYLDVVPIVVTEDGPQIGGLGVPIEYAVCMRQFDERRLALQLLADGRFSSSLTDELASAVAMTHELADRTSERAWGSLDLITTPVVDNFTALRPLIDEPSRLPQLDHIERWSLAKAQSLSTTFEKRRSEGFVRECHGDLHLGNIVQWQGAMMPFDCIEFNPAFRWIDVINEFAFLMMDLDDHDRPDLGSRLLNAYLEQTGDYEGLSVLPFYLVYRAVVRAKVDALRLHQADVSASERQQLTQEWHEYLDLAERYTHPRPVSLTITHGVSGSGKTAGTQSLLEQDRMIRIRSDVERKRLHGLRLEQGARAEIAEGIYSLSASQQTEDRLADLAQTIMSSGFPVIVDATFLKQSLRDRFRQLATESGVSFHILDFHADEPTLRERVRRRQEESQDASDATIEVLEHQLRTDEPLTADERSLVISPATRDREPESTPDN